MKPFTTTQYGTRWIALVLGATVACSSQDKPVSVSDTAPSVRATPAPSFPAESIGTVTRAAILSYGSSLEFRHDFMAADGQYVRMVGNRLGPYVRAVAEIGSALLTRDQLAAGRIIGAVIATEDYPSLGLAKGLNYLWVDSVGSAAKRWRELVIPGDSTLRIRRLAFVTIQHTPDTRFKRQSQAQVVDEPGFNVILWITAGGQCVIVCGNNLSAPNATSLEPTTGDTCPPASRALRDLSQLDTGLSDSIGPKVTTQRAPGSGTPATPGTGPEPKAGKVPGALR